MEIGSSDTSWLGLHVLITPSHFFVLFFQPYNSLLSLERFLSAVCNALAILTWDSEGERRESRFALLFFSPWNSIEKGMYFTAGPKALKVTGKIANSIEGPSEICAAS